MLDSWNFYSIPSTVKKWNLSMYDKTGINKPCTATSYNLLCIPIWFTSIHLAYQTEWNCFTYWGLEAVVVHGCRIRGQVHINYMSTVHFIGMLHTTLFSFINLGPFCADNNILNNVGSFLWSLSWTPYPTSTSTISPWHPLSQVHIHSGIDQCSFVLLQCCICT